VGGDVTSTVEANDGGTVHTSFVVPGSFVRMCVWAFLQVDAVPGYSL